MIRELMTRYLAGEASAPEAQELKEWIAISAENQLEFDRFKKAFDLSTEQIRRNRSAAGSLAIDVDREWDYFRATVEDRKIVPLEKPSRPFGWMRIAAAILLLVTSGLVINYFIYKTSDVHYQTAYETKVIELPDGSKVTLNRKSRLTHGPDFNGENRAVQLSGEAFFEVADNAQMPFIIHTGEGTVEVVGTTFNVQAYDSTSAVEVVVQTGVVLFSVPSVKTLELRAGTKGVFRKQSRDMTSAVNDDVNFQSWNTRRMVFTDAPLRRVVETINKTYNANITVGAGIPESCAVTVTFDQQSLDAVLRVLENTLGLEIRREGNNIEITSAGC